MTATLKVTDQPVDGMVRYAAAKPKPQPVVGRPIKIGRNDQCPCRSGKKFKNCCLRPKVEPLPEYTGSPDIVKSDLVEVQGVSS